MTHYPASTGVDDAAGLATLAEWIVNEGIADNSVTLGRLDIGAWSRV